MRRAGVINLPGSWGAGLKAPRGRGTGKHAPDNFLQWLTWNRGSGSSEKHPSKGRRHVDELEAPDVRLAVDFSGRNGKGDILGRMAEKTSSTTHASGGCSGAAFVVSGFRPREKKSRRKFSGGRGPDRARAERRGGRQLVGRRRGKNVSMRETVGQWILVSVL